MAEKSHRSTGVALPLGALRTEESPVIGEYASLVPFAQFCAQAGLRVIQLLPVLDTGTQSSPYSSLSAFALHPMYITLSQLAGFGALYKNDSSFAAAYDALIKKHKAAKRYDYAALNEGKDQLLRALYATAETEKTLSSADFKAWVEKNSWLPAYCVYKALKYTYMQASWKEWKKADRGLSHEEITGRWNDSARKEAHLFYAWEQYEACRQFKSAADAVRKLGIILKGDLPILLNEDSCDVWADSELFNQKLRAGSPPDGSNPGGQNWGFPTYNWKAHQADGFAWWKMRLAVAEQFYGAYRLDHVLGFFRIWAVPDGEGSAELGHTEPYSAISEAALEKAGFFGDRLTWLSEPHIPTSAIGIGDLSEAGRILSLFCARVKTEELWRFRSDIKTARDVWQVTIPGVDSDSASRIKQTLSGWLHNRTLIELKKGSYVPLWQYSGTQAWQSLSEDEKRRMQALFDENAQKNERAWEKQAEMIFSALIPATCMIPCGEDLGAGIRCLPAVLQKYGILGLEVVRWSRKWAEPGQPYILPEEQRELALVTTSVHDSSTLRQWWQEEKDSVRAFEQSYAAKPKKTVSGRAEQSVARPAAPLLSDGDFSPKAAELVLKACAKTRSRWYIPPLQDWLYLEKKYWFTDLNDERVNVPGTVTAFNWTYRMKESVETLAADTKLAAKIAAIAQAHDNA